MSWFNEIAAKISTITELGSKTEEAGVKGKSFVNSIFPMGDAKALGDAVEISNTSEVNGNGPIDIQKCSKNVAIMYIKALITNEVEKKVTTKDYIKKVDLDYWSEKIYNVAKKHDFPVELIVTIMSTESNGSFKKHVNSGAGSGPMQLTTSGINAFLPNAPGNWSEEFKKLDADLLKDVLSYKDKTAKSVRDRCYQDEEFGIKCGVLLFEMKYVEAVAFDKFPQHRTKSGRPTYNGVRKALDGLKNGSIKLSPKEQKHFFAKAFYYYNGCPANQDSYYKAAMKTIERTGFKMDSWNIS